MFGVLNIKQFWGLRILRKISTGFVDNAIRLKLLNICFDLPLEGVFVGRSFDPIVTPHPWPTQKMTTLAQNKNIKQNIFKKNHLPPKKGAVRSNQLVFYFLHLHPEKENTASVHSGPFQRIHAPQQQRRVTWRWIFVSADGSGGCDFCLARRGVCNMDGFFLKSAQQKNKRHLSTRNSRDCNRKSDSYA